MKKILVIALLFVAVLLLPFLTSACGSSDQMTVSLNKQFTLPAGKTAVFNDASLKIKFVEVSADSRCPQGVQCIQAGQVDCLMLISYLDSQTSMVFTQLGANEDTEQDFNVYTINFGVQPYPQAGKDIKPGDYKMTMIVKKQGQ